MVRLFNIELKFGFGGKYVRSSGSFGMIFKNWNYLNIGIVQLRSGIRKVISLDCRATLGMVSNKDNWLVSLGKAGRKDGLVKTYCTWRAMNQWTILMEEVRKEI